MTWLSNFFRLQSDISRLEAKIERLEAQLAAKDRELATLTRTVCLTFFPVVLTGIKLCFISPLCSNDQASHDQEAKNTAALKAQIEKLQQERDEYQKMVIGNQVNYFSPLCFLCSIILSNNILCFSNCISIIYFSIFSFKIAPPHYIIFFLLFS